MTRTNKTYTIYVNTRPFKVEFKAFICHMTRQLKGLQPDLVYNQFIHSYKFASTEEVRDYSMCINNSYRIGEVAYNLYRESIFDVAILTQYDRYIRKTKTHIRDSLIYTDACSLYINYNDMVFSDAYNSLQPLTQFYHSLIYKITEEDTVEARHIIYPEDINNTLIDLNSDVRFEDIEEDLRQHMLLLKFDDHYEWVSKMFSKWLWKVRYTKMYQINLLKLLTQLRFNVRPKRF